MKLRSMRLERQPRLMIIPLIDVMFFLLVFFMMSTLYMVEQNLIPVNLPQAAERQSDTPRSVAITVTVSGRILLEQEDIPLELLNRRIRLELNRQSDTVFTLRADTKVDYGTVVAVMDELKLAGVQRISIATEKKGRE